jgi:hypothetical protein
MWHVVLTGAITFVGRVITQIGHMTSVQASKPLHLSQHATRYLNEHCCNAETHTYIYEIAEKFLDATKKIAAVN